MKVIQVSSTGVCGIAVYTDRICDSLRAKGHEVIRLSVEDSNDVITSKFSSGAIFHLHTEPSYIDDNRAKSLLFAAKTSGLKSIVTMHYSTKMHCNQMSKNCDFVLLHKNNGEDAANIKYIPMGCPVFDKKNKAELRKKYGINEGLAVVSTFGFLVSWKRFDEVAAGFTQIFKKNPAVVLQMVTSFHKKMEGDSISVYNTVKKIFEKNDVLNRVIWKTEFLHEQEMLERLALSDVGFLYAPVDTGSISAAAKEFVSARLPVVISNSTHFQEMQIGCLKVPKTASDMMDGIQELLDSNVLRNKLELELNELYGETNYDKVTDKHLEIYNSCP